MVGRVIIADGHCSYPRHERQFITIMEPGDADRDAAILSVRPSCRVPGKWQEHDDKWGMLLMRRLGESATAVTGAGGPQSQRWAFATTCVT